MGGPSAAIGHIGRCAGPTDPTDHAAALGSAARAAGRRRGLRSDFFPIVVWFSHSVGYDLLFRLFAEPNLRSHSPATAVKSIFRPCEIVVRLIPEVERYLHSSPRNALGLTRMPPHDELLPPAPFGKCRDTTFAFGLFRCQNRDLSNLARSE